MTSTPVTLDRLFPGKNLPALPLTRVTTDSREAGPGALFVALTGLGRDGHDFLPQAAANGATAALVAHKAEGLPPSFCQVLAEDPGAELGRVCAEVYGTREEPPVAVGVTGTDGKTTTAFLVRYLLNSLAPTCGLIGTLGTEYPDGGHEDTAYTTPPAPALHESWARMRARGGRQLCMELSSQAAVQRRVEGLDWRVLVCTQIGVDHLDYHKSFEAYVDAKFSLFRRLGPEATAVLNASDLQAWRLAEETAVRKVFFLVGELGEALEARRRWGEALGADWLAAWDGLAATYPPEKLKEKLSKAELWQALEVRREAAGLRCRLVCPAGTFELRVPLYGLYNLENTLAALAAATEVAGADTLPALLEALARFPGVPGRMENVAGELPYAVLVDYAHTPGAMEALLRELRAHLEEENRGGRLLTLCNSCGDRDRGKRPLLARTCARLADRVWITLEEVGSENPGEILREICAGLADLTRDEVRAQISCVPLRQEAVRLGIRELKPGDILVLPSLGAQSEYRIGTKDYAYDERRFARECLTERKMAEALLAQAPGRDAAWLYGEDEAL